MQNILQNFKSGAQGGTLLQERKLCRRFLRHVFMLHLLLNWSCICSYEIIINSSLDLMWCISKHHCVISSEMVLADRCPTTIIPSQDPTQKCSCIWGGPGRVQGGPGGQIYLIPSGGTDWGGRSGPGRPGRSSWPPRRSKFNIFR